jgi:predicted MPP superfamily phosphohydrolase
VSVGRSMFVMAYLFAMLALVLSWVGHACIWTAILNYLYGRALPKLLLKWWRYVTALILIAYPFMMWSARNPHYNPSSCCDDALNGTWGRIVFVYGVICLLFALCVFSYITIERWLRRSPTCVVSEQTRTLDLWTELGPQLIGDNKLAAAAKLPGNGIFQVDITDLTLSLSHLPQAWNGLTIQVLSDFHFHGTPSKIFFDRIIDELATAPMPDLVCLLGDYVDSDIHYDWITSILGRVKSREGNLAILGNHDLLFDQARVRRELSAAGCTVLGNGWRELVIRGVRCLAVGHEGPWFKPSPDLSKAPRGLFRLCLSHTPDNFYWAQANHVDLMLCGHVHGGAIRVPIIGPIFIPSVFGRRFDSGVFDENDTIMVIGRGLSGREPLRFRCNPQVIRLRLVRH